MILVRFKTVIKDITVEVEGEAESLTDIFEAWESFILSTYQVEHEAQPKGFNDLDIHVKNLCNPIEEVD
ncbi:MAG: hypothetical protein LUQ50_12770 [Methanospirillum sp.]|uniref:hypothetical protein n=1 Tax=Methanospirillum sp. TaxID=45200 RepID=UPI00236BE4A1|nr:hypothetical protein [Methanospirillum sp.]MDD1729927.1 hypothetical protein [Methanospirillum sp.]